MTAPFSSIHVVDFTHGVAGAFATMHLGDFGADVLRIASPDDGAHRAAPGFRCWDRNKRRLTLDLSTYAGLRAARELIAGADVAVFDAAPGDLERLGIDAATLLARSPRLLHLWMPPYAPKGRWSALPADELLLMAVSGIAWLQPGYAEVPTALITPQVSYAQGGIAANAVAAALRERSRSGLGQSLVVSGLHGVSSIEMAGAVGGDAVPPRGARDPRGSRPNYRLYECGDRNWLFLGTLTAPFFLKALDAMDLVEVMALDGVDGEFANIGLSPMAEMVSARLEARFRERPRSEWLDLLHEHGVPRAPAGERRDWFLSDTVAANEMRLVLEDPRFGEVEIPGISVKLEDTPGVVRHLELPVALETVLAESRAHPVSSPPAPASAEPSAPLAGVRILDLGAFIAGAGAPAILANFGADVIKVEPLDGDPFRALPLMSFGHNPGKRSLAIDLKRPEGLALFEDFVRGADVVLDNFRLGVAARLGLDHGRLSTINPRIITCSITGYGPRGPLARDPGFDPLMQARSGLMLAQGGDEPVFHQIAVNDTATAMMAAFAIQAALLAREQTGRGQHIDTCLANQSVLFQSGELTAYPGSAAPPVGGRDFLGPLALCRYYRCAGGWVAFSCAVPGRFATLAAALGHPEWLSGDEADGAEVAPPDGAVARALEGVLAAMPRDEVLDRLSLAGLPAVPVAEVEALFTDPWLLENAFFTTMDDPTYGRLTLPRAYADWGRSPAGFPRRSPALGEHTRELLAELGLSEPRIAELIASGVVRA